MCGIIGYFGKTGERHADLGATVLHMLAALGCRGPDSAGVALYSDRNAGALTAWIKLGERGDFAARRDEVCRRAEAFAAIREQEQNGEYLRLVLNAAAEPKALAEAIESVDREIEVISLGRSLETIKQVGSPQHLERRFGISRIAGTHAIGHTRLSTESRIDLSHSQPFWAHGTLDLATVHNGHITNYHKLRRQYEQRGVRFYTENDSEIIGIYLAETIERGATFHEALERSVEFFDGSFSYLAATEHELGFAKDRFGFKPLVAAESDAVIAFGTEEIALRAVFGESISTWEPPPGTVRTWRVAGVDIGATAQAGSHHGNR
jgi:glutamate synthase domain-containing protein 1